MTAILMQSTGMVLEKACAEEIEARKAALKQATVKPVKKSAALAALAQFGSSESDSDGENTKDASGLPPPPPGVLKKLATAQKAVEPVITVRHLFAIRLHGWNFRNFFNFKNMDILLKI